MGGPDALRARIAAARRELPAFSIADELVEAHVMRWASSEPSNDKLEIADLVLARACAAGDATALAYFDATYEAEMLAALSTFRADRDFKDDVLQNVREKLFVGAAPKILDYGGRGTLRAWLRAVVMRTALNARRRRLTEPAPGDDDPLLEAAAPSGDPELAEIIQKYGDAYKRAVHDALADLPPEDRNVLRLSLIEGLGLDDMARLYAVHRATVARWMARARTNVVEGARRRLEERTQLEPRELASVARMCRGTLDFSLIRALERP